ncbi:MAG: type II toxin-antitoxin system PemK/MazF family toxin [Pseudomonadota bacterium]
MEKKFDQWNHLKKNLESDSNNRGFEQRDIWWCSLGVNIGNEQDGKNAQFSRPILVLKKFNSHTFLGLPLTTSIKNHPLYYPIFFSGKNGAIILSQIKLFSAKRLMGEKRIGKLSEKIFDDVRKAIKDLI